MAVLGQPSVAGLYERSMIRTLLGKFRRWEKVKTSVLRIDRGRLVLAAGAVIGSPLALLDALEGRAANFTRLPCPTVYL